MLESLEGYSALSQKERLYLRRAMDVLLSKTIRPVFELDYDEALRMVDDSSKEGSTRRGLRTLFRMRMPAWVKDLGHVGFLPLLKLKLNQLALLGVLGYAKLPPDARADLIFALRKTGWTCTADVVDTTKDTLYDMIDAMDVEDAHDIIRPLNRMFRTLERRDPLDYNEYMARKTHGLTRDELAWLAENTRPWYLGLRERILQWEEHEHHMQKRRSMLRLVRIMELKDESDIRAASTDAYRAAIVRCVIETQNHRHSLTKTGRQSRSGETEAGQPGMNTTIKMCIALKALLRFAGTVVDDNLSKLFSAKSVFRQISPILLNSTVDLAEVRDEISGSDVARVLQVTSDPREHLIMLLLCRLGMRIGAVQKLRLTGVLEAGFSAHQESWPAKDRICGLDKNHQINEWILSCSPGVKQGIESYIADVWRPRFERWTVDAGIGRAVLLNGYLFPNTNFEAKGDIPIGRVSLHKLVKAVLERAGITGFNAHAHALRKGYASDLLRAQNNPDLVAKALHHKSMETTLTFYDKRSRAEVLANLKLPQTWCIGEKDSKTNQPEAMPSNRSGSSGKGSHSFVRTDVSALAEEMEMNDIMRMQLMVLGSILTEEQKEKFKVQCVRFGIGHEPPLPRAPTAPTDAEERSAAACCPEGPALSASLTS